MFWVYNFANYAFCSGKIQNLGKSAGVKDLTNIMSVPKQYLSQVCHWYCRTFDICVYIALSKSILIHNSMNIHKYVCVDNFYEI